MGYNLHADMKNVVVFNEKGSPTQILTHLRFERTKLFVQKRSLNVSGQLTKSKSKKKSDCIYVFFVCEITKAFKQ